MATNWTSVLTVECMLGRSTKKTGRTEGNKDEGVNLEDGIKSKTKSRKEVHQIKRERSPPRVDKFRPKKVFTPGSNFMECTSEDEEEMEKAMEQITEKTQIDENAEERRKYWVYCRQLN